MENISPSGEYKFGGDGGQSRELRLDLGPDAEQTGKAEFEVVRNVAEQEIVSLPLMNLEEDTGADGVVVKNNIPDTAKDGEGVEKAWVDLVNECKKKVAEDPYAGQEIFREGKVSFLRSRYLDRENYLVGKIDLGDVKKTDSERVVKIAFNGGKSSTGMGKAA